MALSCSLLNLKKAYEEKLKTSPKGQLTSKTLKKVFLWLYNGTYDEAKKEWEALTHNKHPDVTWLKRKLAKKLTAVSNLVSILPRNIDAEDVPVDSSQDTTVFDGENGYEFLSRSKEKYEKVCTRTKSQKDEPKHDLSGIDLISTLPGCMVDQKGKEYGVGKKYNLRFRNSKKRKPMHRRRALVPTAQQAGKFHNSFSSSSEDSDIDATNFDGGDSPDVVDPSQKTIDRESGYIILLMSEGKNKKVSTPTKPSKDEIKHASSGIEQKGKEDGVKKKYDLRLKSSKKGKPKHRRRALVTRMPQVCRSHNSSLSSSEDSHAINVDAGDSPDVVDPSQKTIDGENGYSFLSMSRERNKACTPTNSSKDKLKHNLSGINQEGKKERVRTKYDLRFKNTKKGKPDRNRALVTSAQQVHGCHNSISSSEDSDSDTIIVDAGDSPDVVDPSQKTIDGESGYAILSMSREKNKKVCTPTKPSKDESKQDSSGIDQGAKEDGVSRKFDPRRRSSKKGKEPKRRKSRDSVTRAQQTRKLRNKLISSSEGSDIPVDMTSVHNGDSPDVVDSSQETIDGENDQAFLPLSRERAEKVHSSTPRKLPNVRNASIASPSHSAGKDKESRENELVESGKQHGKPSSQSTSKQTSLGLIGDIGETSETSDRETYHLGERYLGSEEHENQASTSGHTRVIDQVRKTKALSKDLSTATQNLKRIVNDPYQGYTTEDEDLVLEEPDQRQGKRRWNAPQNNAAVVEWGCNDIDEDLERLREKSKLEAPKRRKRKYWSLEETQWLKEGVKMFGKGNWAQILTWYSFNERSSVDLKDKYRNMERNHEL